MAEKEARQQEYRKEYEQLKSQVRSDPNFKNESPEKIDMVVAMLVIKNNIAQNNSKNQLQRVAEVLSQSGQLRWLGTRSCIGIEKFPAHVRLSGQSTRVCY